MPHQLFYGWITGKENLSRAKKYFYKENSDVTWEDFLKTKFALWMDTRSSIDSTCRGSGKIVEKSGILIQIEKAPETNGDIACYVFSLEYALNHLLSVTDPSGILKIEK